MCYLCTIVLCVFYTVGIRIMTAFIYLNTVEDGGGTNFPLVHNLTVQPKRGRVLIWPNVLDSSPDDKDWRMIHQALPVQGDGDVVKYAANLFIHQRNFISPFVAGCIR